MRLAPLQQWICDTCGQVIRKPEEGYVEWLRDQDHNAHGFRVVHHALASPHHPEGDCYRYSDAPGRADTALDLFVGPEGLMRALVFIDVGPYHNADFTGPHVRDLREWTELVRRLHLPHYEEARTLWGTAEQDDFFAGANELFMYSPDTLQRLVERYGGANNANA